MTRRGQYLFRQKMRARIFLTAPGCALTVGLLISGCSSSSFRPPEREGPPGLVQQESGPGLWLMLKQEEQRSRYLGGSRVNSKWVTETYYHFDLQAHDPAPTRAALEKKTVADREG